MRQRIGAACSKASWWCLLAIAVLTPFFTTNTSLGAGRPSQLTFDAIALPKLSLVVFLGGFGLALFAVSVAGGVAEPRRSRTMLLVAVFLGWVGLSTVTSVSPSASVIGVALSDEGLAAFVAYGLVFVLAVQHVTTIARVRTIVTAAVAAGALIACYSLLQSLKLDPVAWPTSAFGERIFATFGNPDLLASYLVFPFALSTGLLLSEESDTPRFWLAAFALLTTSICLVIGLARGAWIAAPVALGVMTLAVWRSRLGLRSSQRWMLAVEALVVLASAAATLAAEQGASIVARGTSLVARSASKSLGDRIEIWRTALTGISRRPLLGWGPDTFKYVYHAAAGTTTWLIGGHGSYADNAHNMILQMAATLGVPGLLLYGSVIAAPLAETTRALFGMRETGSSDVFGADDAHSRMLVAGVWAAALTLVTILLLEPSTPMVVVWLWLSIGILAAARTRPVSIKSEGVRIVAVAVSILLFAVGCWGVSWLYADMLARRALDTSVLSEAEDNLSRAVAVNPLAQQYYIISGERTDELLWSSVRSGAPPDTIATLAHDSSAAYAKAVGHDPQDPVASIDYVHALNQEQSLAPSQASAAEALAAAQSAVSSWPNVPDAVHELARAQFQAGQLARAERTAIRATELDPGFEYAWLTIGEIRTVRGDRAGARTALTTAVQLDPSDSDAIDALRRIAGPNAGQGGSQTGTGSVHP